MQGNADSGMREISAVGIRNPESGIRNMESGIWNPSSSDKRIRNPVAPESTTWNSEYNPRLS